MSVAQQGRLVEVGVGERKTGERLEIRITKTGQGRGERHLEEPTHRMKEDRREFKKKNRGLV